MATRSRGSIRVRGSSISIVLDLGEQPWRKCPTPRCSGSTFTDSRAEMACGRCGALLEAPVPQRRRVWHSGFKNRSEAKKALTAMLGQVDTASFVEPSALTLREFVEGTWLPSLETSTLRESTVEMYRRSVHCYVLPHLGSLRLRDVSPARLASWLEELKATGTGDRTVEIAGICAHKLLKSALDRELIARNPADNGAVRSARPKPKAKAPTVWSTDQTRAFLDSQRDDRLFALWRLAAMTGLRRGELVGLRWRDVDLDAGAVRVSATRVVVNYSVVDSAPKTEKSRRTISLDGATVAALRQHRSRQTEEMFAIGRQRSDDGYVFTSDPGGNPYHPDRITRTLAAKARATGLPVVRLHSLRHSHASAAILAGVPLKVVSERLGHSSIAVTSDVYGHVTTAADQAAADQVAAAIDGVL